MKKLIIILLIIFTSVNIAYTDNILFQCENGFSYKIDYRKNDTFLYFKTSDKDWKKVEKSNISKNKYELFLPNSRYLQCSDKSLAICYYSTLIKYEADTGKANVREVVINDCYIGTMGCNKYEKGLELNERRCLVKFFSRRPTKQ